MRPQFDIYTIITSVFADKLTCPVHIFIIYGCDNMLHKIHSDHHRKNYYYYYLFCGRKLNQSNHIARLINVNFWYGWALMIFTKKCKKKIFSTHVIWTIAQSSRYTIATRKTVYCELQYNLILCCRLSIITKSVEHVNTLTRTDSAQFCAFSQRVHTFHAFFIKTI